MSCLKSIVKMAEETENPEYIPIICTEYCYSSVILNQLHHLCHTLLWSVRSSGYQCINNGTAIILREEGHMSPLINPLQVYIQQGCDLANLTSIIGVHRSSLLFDFDTNLNMIMKGPVV